MSDQTEVVLNMDYVKSYMDKHYTLVYIDYDSNFNDNLKPVQEAIRKQEWYPLDEDVTEWLWDAESDGVDYAIDELKKELIRAEDFEEEEIEDFIDENIDDIRMTIEDRDDSTPLEDMIRNTKDPVMFYDTGLSCDEPFDHQGVIETLDNIKELLNITDDKYDDVLDMMIAQASYGGSFVVYFNGDIKEMLDLEGKNAIQFKNAYVAIVDHFNGSGDHCQLDGLTFTLPLDLENLFFDKSIKYSYTYDVCGMYSNWCEETSVKFLTIEKPGEIQGSSLNAFADREEKLNKVFKNGGCTAGDMDMRRHRNTYYVNDFPCGTHCPKCHTFWID